MKTYTALRNLTAEYCNVSTSDTTSMTVIDNNINDSIRTICNLQGGKLRFLEATKDMTTVASQEGYQIPNGFRKLIDIWVYSDDGSSTTSTIYSPEMVFDPTKWKLIKQYRYGTNDVPYFTYVENQKYYIQPIPATTGNLIKLRGRLQTRDLTIADYTTGTITSVPYTTTLTGSLTSGAVSATLSGSWGLPTGDYSVTFSNGEARIVTLTNGATTATWDDELTSSATSAITVSAENGGSIVTGGSVTWTRDMVGRYIQITETTAANGGDGFWYEIGEYLDSTHVALLKPYEGVAISAGTAAYTLGQCSVVPAAYDVGIVYRATALFWDNQGQSDRAKTWWLKYDGGMEAGYSKEYGGLISQMLANEGETEEGAYIPPFGTTVNLPTAPYYFPYQDASGFN